MTPAAKAASIEFWQIQPILESVSDQVDVATLLQRLNLPESLDKTNLETPIPLAAYFRLQRDIARSLDDITLHLSSRQLIYQTGDFIVEQIKQARTLQDAIQCVASYFNMMHGGTYNTVRQRDNYLTLVVDDSSFPYTFRSDGTLTHFIGDCILIKVHCLLESLSHGLAGQALRWVGLLRTRNEPGDGQNQFWSVPIKYGRPVYELTYDFDLACKTIAPPNEVDLSTDGLFARTISHLEQMQPSASQRSFSARTLEIVTGGCVQQDKVASELGISVATLRRRLTDEAVSFRDLVHQARFERAKTMLQHGRSVSQVSDELEYSDIRAFNRAFKKWTGLTPSAFAKSQAPSA